MCSKIKLLSNFNFTIKSSDINAYLVLIHLNDLGGPILLIETPNFIAPD